MKESLTTICELKLFLGTWDCVWIHGTEMVESTWYELGIVCNWVTQTWLLECTTVDQCMH